MSESILTVQASPGDPSSSEEGSFDVDVVPPPAPSPLDGLKAKLAAAKTKLWKDIEVPRWPDLMGMQVFVRFSPASPAYAAEAADQFRKSKAKDWTIQANAQVLVQHCIGVYAVDPSDPETKLSMRPGDPDGEWTTFDTALAVTLGLINSEDEFAQTSAIAVCRKLYFTDGDLVIAAAQLSDWSSQVGDDVDLTTP